MSDFQDLVNEIADAAAQAIEEFKGLIGKYFVSMDPGTDPLSQPVMKSMAAAIIEDFFIRVDDELNSTVVAYAVIEEYGNRRATDSFPRKR